MSQSNRKQNRRLSFGEVQIGLRHFSSTSCWRSFKFDSLMKKRIGCQNPICLCKSIVHFFRKKIKSGSGPLRFHEPECNRLSTKTRIMVNENYDS